MMCFNPPCPNAITCIAANGDDVLVSYRGHSKGVVFAQFHPDSGKVVSLGGDGDIDIWATENGAKMSSQDSEPTANWKLVTGSGTPWSTDGRRLAWAEFMDMVSDQGSEIHVIR